MTIDAAIKQLKRGTRENRSTANKLLREALELGINALKQYKEMKATGEIWDGYYLPGETKEGQGAMRGKPCGVRVWWEYAHPMV